MGEVYKRASAVVAWVGENTNGRDDNICNFLNSVGRIIKEDPTNSRAWNWAERNTYRRAVQWVQFREELGRFFQKSWFTRMWPIQEVTLPLPGKVNLLCGEEYIPLEYVRVGWQVLANCGVLAGAVHLDQSVALQFYLADALALKRNLTKEINHLGKPLITDLSQLSLQKIMRATRFKACSLAKDKFFALYSVFEELQIPHKVDISKYADMTEHECFMAIFDSCAESDTSLDILKLAQSAEGYIGPLDFGAKRLDTVDSFANMLHGAFATIQPFLSRGKLDNIPPWRHLLPSWLPDWSQWTHGDMNDRDIAFIRVFSARAMWKNNLTSDPNELGDVRKTKDVFQRPTNTANSVTVWRVENKAILRVHGRIVGRVRSVGTVDSTGLMWQSISTMFNFYFWQSTSRNITQEMTADEILEEYRTMPRVLPAYVAAVIATARGLVLNSILSQAMLSLRLVYKASDFMTFMRYLAAFAIAFQILPKIKEKICSLCPSETACQQNSSRTESSDISWEFLVAYTLSRSSYRFYHRFKQLISSTLLLVIAVLMLQFRVSLWDSMYESSYKRYPEWYTKPMIFLIIVQFSGFAAGFCKDDIMFLLTRVIVTAGQLFIMPTIFTMPYISVLAVSMLITFLYHACRHHRAAFREILGSDDFVPSTSFASGLNLFTTERD
jgi:hypothetical protein